jgi:hypothetical protein
MPQFLLLLFTVPALIFGSATAAEKQELPMTQPVSVSHCVITARSTETTFHEFEKSGTPIHLIVHSDFTDHKILPSLLTYIQKSPQVVGVTLGYQEPVFSKYTPLDLTTAGSEQILQSLQNRSDLQRLTFGTAPKLEEKKFAEILSTHCASMTNLTELKLHNIEFGEQSYQEIAKIITQNTKLKTLELTRSVRAESNADAEAQIPLLEALQKMPTSLSILALTRLKLSGDSSELLWTALSAHPDLMVLTLAKCDIYQSDFIKLKLAGFTNLTSLNLSYNQIAFDSATQFIFEKIIANNLHAKSLDLSHNQSITSKVLKSFEGQRILLKTKNTPIVEEEN